MRLGANPIQEPHLLRDVAYIKAQCLSQALGRYAALNGTTDHVVLLNRRESIDPAVVGVSLIVLGFQTWGFSDAEFAQGNHADVTIQQQAISGLPDLRGNRQRFDQPDLLD